MKRITATLCAALLGAVPVAAQPAPDYRSRAASDEVIYFVLPDRFENADPRNDMGGLNGDRLVTGFDPADKGFYHGGDLKGLKARLPYLQKLGITAIWVAPIFRNKPVQGPVGHESAGYHGYWVTDFTRPDPHLGTEADFAGLVTAAHALGMKVYMDIITNHTADVIRYREGDAAKYAYRSRADYPYSRKGGLGGASINPGFAGDQDSSEANFAKLTDPSSAYTPYVPQGERNAKTPAWLNDPIFYHNRGDSTFTGEDARFGDFSGLDDLFTEHPRVRDGMIEIYKHWVDRYKIDGYRIDTARHVDPGFWQAFVPAIRQAAKAQGMPNFALFAEVYRSSPDSGYIAQYTRRDALPAVLDFSFQATMREVLGKGKGTVLLAELFDGDVLYEGGEAAARSLPTFLGNHDMGRFSTLVKEDRPGIANAELLARVTLGHAMLLTLRGAPVIYSGDEQGFVGDGGDQASREDMFPSKVASYNDNALIGTSATTAASNFDENHPLFRTIAGLSAIRRAHPALASGHQIVRDYAQTPGLFAISRFDPVSGTEYFIAFNTADHPIDQNSTIGTAAGRLESLSGQCPAAVSAPGSVRVTLPAFGWMVCRAKESLKP
ncbi:alpha-amylase family glycosyl hydrolase [Novosphingobium sp. MMS21-SN21R]|uniref:alpha-amylase family glycosyl hydrolase n=1 Tax=Novosphingobium sp. MMS21-SN21R TaxID=2969298 RepID=UPI002884774B|nr:alpha-amylase family glycosyl hydrolase [Novosphingobium sp. MMS21-SN21R]MDT0507656.1 alpha-amylase family glycosyl hydrolase [Novosphingobium sp. MMS21-SN21R]